MSTSRNLQQKTPQVISKVKISEAEIMQTVIYELARTAYKEITFQPHLMTPDNEVEFVKKLQQQLILLPIQTGKIIKIFEGPLSLFLLPPGFSKDKQNPFRELKPSPYFAKYKEGFVKITGNTYLLTAPLCLAEVLQRELLEIILLPAEGLL